MASKVLALHVALIITAESYEIHADPQTRNSFRVDHARSLVRPPYKHAFIGRSLRRA